MHYVHKLKRSTIEKIVGWFIVVSIAVVIAVLVGLSIRSKIFEKEYHLVSVIKEGYGLRSGTLVKLAGIDVGEVVDISFNEENKIKILMKINRKFQQRIRGDSKSIISSSGLVGDKFVNITVGSMAAPPLADGDSIQMIEPVEIGDLGARLNTIIKQIEDILSETYGIVHKVNSSSIVELDAALKNVRKISADIKDSKMITLLSDEEAYKSAKDSVNKLNMTMENLKKSSDNIPGIVAKVDSMVEEANKVVKALQKHWLIRAYIKEDNKEAKPQDAGAAVKPATVDNGTKKDEKKKENKK